MNQTAEMSLTQSQAPTRTWLLFLVAATIAMACAAALPALSFLEAGFWRSADTARMLDMSFSTFLGMALAQPVSLLIRIVLVSLTAQMVLLLLGHPVRFALLFRISLIASFAQLVQLALAFVPVFEFRDLAHTYATPGSLAMFLPGLAVDKVWGGAIRQLTIFDLAWGFIYFTLLRRLVPRNLAVIVPMVIWLVAFLVIWLLSMAMSFVGAPA